jgi:hypothetical protein
MDMKHIKTFESFVNESGMKDPDLKVGVEISIEMDDDDGDFNAGDYQIVGLTRGGVILTGMGQDNLQISFGALSDAGYTINEAYKNIPATMKIAGEYEITIGSKTEVTKVAGFERENDDSDSLYLMDNDPLKDEHGSFTVKNSDMPKLSKGMSVKGACSKHNTPVTLKRIGDL